MHAYLYIGEKEKCIGTIKEFIKNSKFDVTHEYLIDSIEDVRNLKQIFTSAERPTAIILHDFEKSSIPAQNALLKLLEEPPKNITFFLYTTNSKKILPTIASRCQLVRVKPDATTPNNQVRQFMEGDNKERLSLLENLKTREDAIAFLEALIISYQNEIKNGEKIKANTKSLFFANQAYTFIKANGNIKLQLKNFLIQSYL